MVSRIDIEYETASGDTSNSTQTMLPLAWHRATLTMRRRAPHTIEVEPDATIHLIDEFKAGRLWRLSKDGVYWQAGFMAAPSPVRRREGWGIALPGWGNAYALALNFRNGPSSPLVSFTSTDADAVITSALDACNHGTGGDWFPSGGRTLGSGGALANFTLAGKNYLELINDMADLEAWDWRSGIDAAGVWTFAASANVKVDRSDTIRFVDGANCVITSVDRDGSRLLTDVTACARRPTVRTQLNGAHGIGVTTITVDSTTDIYVGQILVAGEGTATKETLTAVVSILSPTQFTITTGVALAHLTDEIVQSRPGTEYLTTAAFQAVSVEDDHHASKFYVYNDQMRDTNRQFDVATAHVAAYDHVLVTAQLETTDAALIAACLTTGIDAGDSVQVTSPDRQLSRLFSGHTMKAQEIVWELEAGLVRRVRMTVGDLGLDALGVLERKLSAAHAAATAAER